MNYTFFNKKTEHLAKLLAYYLVICKHFIKDLTDTSFANMYVLFTEKQVLVHNFFSTHSEKFTAAENHILLCFRRCEKQIADI